MAAPNLQPDVATIEAHIRWFTQRWHELGVPLQIEVRSFGSTVTPLHGRFPFSDNGIAEAAAWAADLNRHPGRNVYMVINPLRDGVLSGEGGSATDADVVASCLHWAEADDEAQTSRIRNWAGPKWAAYTITGREPESRVHVYWPFREWCRDLAAWKATQQAIAHHLDTDRQVVNPSRVMRLAGSINWPKKGKPGRVAELVTWRTMPDAQAQDRETFARLFTPRPGPQIEPQGGLVLQRTPDPLDRDAAAHAALSGREWHNNMVRLVASYVARGLEDHEIHAMTDRLTLPGYTVEQTRREVQQAIDGARRKGWTGTAGGAEQASGFNPPPPDPEQVEAMQFQPWQVMDLAKIPRVQFVYSDFYARGYSSVTIAPPKQGKSMLALAEAIDMATGRGILTGVPDDPRTVLYYNAEDDQNVLHARVAALLTLYDIPQEEIAGRLYVVSGVDAEGFYLIDGEEGMVDEALFVALEKFIHASGVDAVIFDPLQDLSNSPETNEVFRRLGRRLRKMASSMGIAIGLVHHTRKVAPGMAPTIDDGRGGSALRGTARFNRVLAGMTEDEALKAGVENHRLYVRIGDAESNLAPPSADINRWFEKVSVTTPSGENVGAVRPWKWPDAFDGVTAKDAARVRAAVSAAFDADPMQCRADVQAKLWVGRIVAETLGLDADNKQDKERIKTMIRTWLDSGVLAREVAFDPEKRQDRPVIAPGPTRPGEAE